MHASRWLRVAVPGSVVLLGCMVLVHADDAARPQAAAREQAARRFAAEHHPELARLLGELARQDRRQYDAAIADIHRAIDRMEKHREKQPERYEATLEDWKLSSRIRLAVARMSLTRDPELEAELRELVEARQKVRLRPLRAEAERIEARLERIRSTLAEHDADPEAAVEKELAALLRTARSAEERVRGRAARPAAATPVEETPPPPAKPEA
jgi:oligoendopeptidase F